MKVVADFSTLVYLHASTKTRLVFVAVYFPMTWNIIWSKVSISKRPILFKILFPVCISILYRLVIYAFSFVSVSLFCICGNCPFFLYCLAYAPSYNYFLVNSVAASPSSLLVFANNSSLMTVNETALLLSEETPPTWSCSSF